MATHSSILAWMRIPWTDQPCGLHPVGSQRVRHDWTTEQRRIKQDTLNREFKDGKRNVFLVKSLWNTYLHPTIGVWGDQGAPCVGSRGCGGGVRDHSRCRGGQVSMGGAEDVGALRTGSVSCQSTLTGTPPRFPAEHLRPNSTGRSKFPGSPPSLGQRGGPSSVRPAPGAQR